MALPALKEQQFAERLASNQAKKSTKERRMGQILQFPTGRPIGTDAAMAREAELPTAERFQSEQARRRAEGNKETPEELQALQDQGLLSDEAFEQAKTQTQQAVQQLRAASTLQQALSAKARLTKLREEFAGIALSEKQRKEIDEFREMIWRGVRVGGPAVDDFAAGWTLGLGTGVSYVIWIWQAIKGMKYRNTPEPLTVISIMSPPPMPLSVAGKGTVALLKTLTMYFIDALGFLWNNFNAAIVVLFLALFVIILILFDCYSYPITSEFKDVCSQLMPTGELLKFFAGFAD